MCGILYILHTRHPHFFRVGRGRSPAPARSVSMNDNTQRGGGLLPQHQGGRVIDIVNNGSHNKHWANLNSVSVSIWLQSNITHKNKSILRQARIYTRLHLERMFNTLSIPCHLLRIECNFYMRIVEHIILEDKSYRIYTRVIYYRVYTHSNIYNANVFESREHPG